MKHSPAVSLRARFILYLVCIHLLFASVAVYLLLKHRIWLLAVEAVFLLSLSIGVKLIRNLFGTIDLLNTGAQFIEDSDFTSRFREIGQAEMDRLIGVYNRMIDHLRLERTRMQEQNYFLEKVLDASPSGVVTFDFDGRIVMVNPVAVKLLGRSSPELWGKSLEDLDAPLAVALRAVAVDDSRVISIGGRRRVKCQRSHFLDRGFARNFILLEELTEELRQAEKTAYEKVIRLMSHEVNNSVGSANSLLHSSMHYAPQLRSEDRSDFETAINIAINRTDHLNSFMRNFADVFRLPPPRLEPTDCLQLLKELAVLFREEMERREIATLWDLELTALLIPMDRRQMEQALVNILKNAIEAIDRNGVITFRVGTDGGRDFLVIEDTGKGVSAAARDYLFTPFFSDKENGQGIGLTLVQEILDQHGFEYSLESRAGGPTEFRISF
jgi:two-component system, NtrC family, nitrogen regulation sensor histidine kinase NtrY